MCHNGFYTLIKTLLTLEISKRIIACIYSPTRKCFQGGESFALASLDFTSQRSLFVNPNTLCSTGLCLKTGKSGLGKIEANCSAWKTKTKIHAYLFNIWKSRSSLIIPVTWKVNQVNLKDNTTKTLHRWNKMEEL